MSNSNSSVPKYRKHASGQARVTINGRDYYLGPWRSRVSINEYDRIIAEYLASGRSNCFGLSRNELSVAMLMVDYLKFAKQYYGTGAKSEWHRIKLALRPVKRLYANTSAGEFDPPCFKAIRQTMIDDGLSRPGINQRMKRITRMFKWSASEGQLSASVYETLRLIPSLKRGRTAAPETERIIPVGNEVVVETLKRLHPILADMVRVQLLTGCRPGEICMLTPAMINCDEDVWTAELSEHKTAHHGHTRTLYIGPEAQQILAGYLNRPDTDCLFRPIDVVEARRAERSAKRKTPPSCGNSPGKKNDRGGLKGTRAKKQPGIEYTTESYRRAIHYACDKAFPAPDEHSVKSWQSDHRWSPNQLRHARATEIRSQFGLEAAQVILGHSKADVTQVYAERDHHKAREVARQVG